MYSIDKAMEELLRLGSVKEREGFPPELTEWAIKVHEDGKKFLEKHDATIMSSFLMSKMVERNELLQAILMFAPVEMKDALDASMRYLTGMVLNEGDVTFVKRTKEEDFELARKLEGTLSEQVKQEDPVEQFASMAGASVAETTDVMDLSNVPAHKYETIGEVFADLRREAEEGHEAIHGEREVGIIEFLQGPLQDIGQMVTDEIDYSSLYRLSSLAFMGVAPSLRYIMNENRDEFISALRFVVKVTIGMVVMGEWWKLYHKPEEDAS